MICRGCGHPHDVDQSCTMKNAPFYFHITDYPKGFDWKNGVIESFIVACGDQSEVDLMIEYALKGLKIRGWAFGKVPPNRNTRIEIVDGGYVTIIYRWAPNGLHAAYEWWEQKHGGTHGDRGT